MSIQVFVNAGVSISHIESKQTKTRSTRAEFLVNAVGTVSSAEKTTVVSGRCDALLPPSPFLVDQPTDPKIISVLDALRARRSVIAVSFTHFISPQDLYLLWIVVR